MPHIDTLSLITLWNPRGQSRFARPVAAVTAFVVRSRHALAKAFAGRHASAAPRMRQDLEIRNLEEHYAHAIDLPHLERMERDWDRRDGGGMRTWDWR